MKVKHVYPSCFVSGFPPPARPPVTHEGRVGIRSSERELGQIGIRWRVLKGYFALALSFTPIHARLAQFAIPFLSLPPSLPLGEGLAA